MRDLEVSVQDLYILALASHVYNPFLLLCGADIASHLPNAQDDFLLAGS